MNILAPPGPSWSHHNRSPRRVQVMYIRLDDIDPRNLVDGDPEDLDGFDGPIPVVDRLTEAWLRGEEV